VLGLKESLGTVKMAIIDHSTICFAFLIQLTKTLHAMSDCVGWYESEGREHDAPGGTLLY